MSGDPQLPDRYVRAIYGFKTVALCTILTVYWVIEVFVSPFGSGAAISAVLIIALAPTLVILSPRREIPQWLLRLSLYVDAFALTVGVHLGGGIDNVSVPLLYTAVIGLAGLLLSRRDTIAVALTSALLYDAMALAEYAGVLAHLVAYGRPPARQLGTAIPVNLFLLLFGWLVSYAVAQIRAMYRGMEELRREAVHVLSHDLKSPLAIIYDSARLMQTAANEDREVFGGAIERAAQQALDLVSNVLDAAAFEGRPITPRFQAAQINQLVSDVIAHYEHAAAAGRTRLHVEIDPTLPAAEVDAPLIARAVGNLISNAIKYGGAGGTVHVSTEARNGRVLIHVRDTGPGIAAADQALLFQRYSRTSTAHGIEGSGLGLYIVRRIADAHRGTAGVSSAVGRGSTFSLSIPLVARHATLAHRPKDEA